MDSVVSSSEKYNGFPIVILNLIFSNLSMKIGTIGILNFLKSWAGIVVVEASWLKNLI